MNDRPLVLTFGNEEMVIRRRYETLSIVNDFLIAVWFLFGSFLFFSPTLTYWGTWLFVLGSAQLLIRPIIRLSRQVHLSKMRGDAAGGGGHDF